MFYDRNDHAVLIPGAREKRLMTQGQRAGSYIGEAVRFIGQFKTFPVTLMTKYNMPEGKELGLKLKQIENRWVDNNFTISEKEVEKLINN